MVDSKRCASHGVGGKYRAAWAAGVASVYGREVFPEPPDLPLRWRSHVIDSAS